jgi:hypothetical protein
MIKVFFLIFESEVTWAKIALAGRGYAHILFTSLLPLIALATVAEGWGLLRAGKWQPRFQRVKEFSIDTVVVFEILQGALFLGMVLLSAFVLLKISRSIDGRRTYLQTFRLMAYAFSPFFLLQILNALPGNNPFTPWIIGIALTCWVLYQGVPRVMEVPPTQAFGLYLSAMIVSVLAAGVARVFTSLYLLGSVEFRLPW